MSIKRKVLLLFLAVALFPAVSIFLLYQFKQDPFKETAHFALESVRINKRAQVEQYMKSLGDTVRTLAESGVLPEAFLAFKNGYDQIERTAVKKEMNYLKSRDRLHEWYKSKFLPLLSLSSKPSLHPDALLQMSPSAIHLQDHYLAKNPNEIWTFDSYLGPQDRGLYHLAHRKYHSLLKTWLGRFGLVDLFLLDKQGRILYSSAKKIDFARMVFSSVLKGSGLSRLFKKYRNASFQAPVLIEDFQPYLPNLAEPLCFLGSAIVVEQQNVGLFAVAITAERLNEIMSGGSRWDLEGLGHSGESYLVGPDFLLRSSSRIRTEQKESLKSLLSIEPSRGRQVGHVKQHRVETEAIRSALNGISGTRVVPGHQGHDVLNSFTPLKIQGLHWALVTEMKLVEAYLDSRDFWIYLSLISVFFLILIMALHQFFSLRLLIPISQLSLAAEKLGAESVHAPIPILAHDEIGNLQNTYNFMAKNLLETQDHLSKEVRTSTDASKNLQKSKALLNQVLESIPLSIYWKDLDSRYLGANKQFASNMGLEDPSKLLGKKNEELPIPEHESFTLQELESQMEGLDANVTNTTLRLSNQSGEETWYQVTVLPLKSDQAQLIGILGIMEDLTEKTRSGEELRGIRQLRSMDTFTGSIAHEFRNVLQGLLGQVSCLQVATARDPLSEKYLERTRNQIEIASELSEKLLTITKSGNLPIRHDSIGAILEAAVEESLSNSDTVHILEVDPEIRNVEMERLTLHQIIQNLVLNASQSMDGRGTVELRAMVKKLDSTNEVALPEGSYVFLSVKDQGAGIPEGLRKKIFDPFFSGKDTGTGLGLSTVQALVTKLNGTILVHSTPGMGTEFQVFLPLDVDTPSDVPPPRDFLHGSGRVLVLDDREMVLQTTGEVLTLLGYEVTLTRSGVQALKAHRDALEGENPFDVAILDLNVPGELDGAGTMERIRMLDSQISGILSTAYIEHSVFSNYQKYGFQVAIRKPHDFSELSRILYNLTANNKSRPSTI